MKYINAVDVLPQKLIEEIQIYTRGNLLYIPNGKNINKKKWGEKNGTRQYYIVRNEEIRNRYKEGQSILKIAQCYGLAFDTVKKIIYSQSK